MSQQSSVKMCDNTINKEPFVCDESYVRESISKEDAEFYLKDENYIETPSKIVETYFKGQHLQRLVRHQIESYNLFVNHQIEQTI